ncbi:MAG: DUF599 family protein, partial [Candidatus Hodarchaeota archaeon]
MHEIALLTFLICISVYSLMLLYGLKCPEKIRRGQLVIIYHNWIKHSLNDISVAIQVIRNLIMGSSIFISGLLVLLGLVLAYYTLQNSQIYIFQGITPLSLILVQIGFIILIIVFCLFNFVYSVRLAIRFSFIISAKPQEISFNKINGLELTSKTLFSLQNHWMFGIRG